MRVALVTEYYYPHLGGVTEHVANLSRQFQQAGHTTLIVTGTMTGQPSGEQHVARVGRSQVIFSNGSFARVTLGLVVAIEIALALAIRDGLLLNVVMLVHPIEAVRVWQAHH